MDKISGIIPSSARVSSVDMKEASPIRPGTPSFGRPEGVSSLRPEVALGVETTAKRATGIQQEVATDWRTKDTRQAALVQDLSDKFFIKNRQAAGPAQTQGAQMPALPAQIAAASTPAGFKTDEVGSLRATSIQPLSFMDREGSGEEELMMPAEMKSASTPQPPGLYPKGSFIDFSA